MEKRPDNVFISVPVSQAEKYLTYDIASFVKRAARVSGALKSELKMREGDKVAILSDSPNEMALLLHGIWLARMVAVPLYLHLPDDILIGVIAGFGVTTVVFPLEASARVANMFSKTPSVKHWIVSGNVAIRTAGAQVKKLDDLLAAAVGTELQDLGDSDKDCGALVALTEGVTGKPKEVLLTQSQLLGGAAISSQLYPLEDKETEVAWNLLPRKSFNGILHSYLLPLISDIPAVLNVDFDVKKFWEHVIADGITFALLEQSQLLQILKRGKTRTWRPPQKLKIGLFTTVPFSGEIIATFEKRFGVAVLTCYSQTEAGGIITAFPHSFGAEERLKWLQEYSVPSSGVELDGLAVKVVDMQGREVAQGVSGEILVRGPQVANGYLGQRTRGAENTHVDKDSYLHTGDEGFYIPTAQNESKKHLFILGRIYETVERNSIRINPAIIDGLLYEINGIEYGLGVAFPNAHTGFEIGAYVVTSRASNLTETDIIEGLRKRLSAAESPKVVVLGEKPKAGAFPRRSEVIELFDRYYDVYFSGD